MTPTPHLTLNDGHHLPAIGFGTYPLRGREAYRAVRTALDAGYRLIDSAANYDNEGAVGRAVRDFLAESGTARDQITVQTKLPGRHHQNALAVTQESAYRLGLDRIDVQLIHWPNPLTGHYGQAWEGLLEAREQGIVRTVGVSNFTDAHLDTIIAASGVTPAINQIELHPFFTQAEARADHASRGIITEAWSPLGKAFVPWDEPTLTAIAATHGVTTAQVMLRWHVQCGTVAVPKASTPERQAENIAIFDFELSPSDVERIEALTRPDGRIFGGDPTTHEER